jgi:hypothetical protein
LTKKGLGLALLILVVSSVSGITLIGAVIPNGWWYGDWLVEKNINATISVKSPLGEFGNITSTVFVDYILAQSPSVNDVWNYITRTLTNLNDTRADMIDNLDVLLSTRATQTSVDTIDGIVDAILIDTNELQTDWVNGGRLDLLIDAIKAKTDTIVANGATQASVNIIDGIVDTILVDTNELQVDWVNGGRLDLLIDAIKAKTDIIPSTIATSLGYIPSDLNRVPRPYYLIASDNLRYSYNTEQTGTQTSFTKMATLTLSYTNPISVAGALGSPYLSTSNVLRVSFDLHRTTASFVRGRIYRNGVAVGAIQETTSDSYVTFSEDINNWSVGDAIELWTYTGNILYPVYNRNFRVYADLLQNSYTTPAFS